LSDNISKLVATDESRDLALHLSPNEPAARPAWRQMDYLPVGLFGSVMGLTDLSVAWRSVGAPGWVAGSIGAVAVTAFAVLTIGYAVKLGTAPGAVWAEFRRPVAGNLFGTFFISLLVLPIIIAPVSLKLSQVMWIGGAAGMLIFAWLMVSRWMGNRQQVADATPAWIVPVVGLLNVPLALPSLGLPMMDGVAVLGLAVGLFFAVPLFTVIFSRLVFEPPMPPALQPTLVILAAPFAVGFSAYVATTGQVDLFARALYVLMLFILAVLAGRLRHLGRSCPFRVSWWAVSFPLSASAVAGLRFALAEPGAVTDAIALMLLGVATAVIAGLLLRTLLGVVQGELRTLSS
jgi:tellurite resistance protein